MDERLDLSPLDLDEAQRELMIVAILARASGELAGRAADDSAFMALSGWARPALAAAAVLAVLCLPVLSAAPRAERDEAAGLTDALEVPAPVDEWIAAERAPTVGDVLFAMDREGR